MGVESMALNNESKPEYIICAACWFKDGKKHKDQPKNIKEGYVVTGRRHHNCLRIADVFLLDGGFDGIKYPEKTDGNLVTGFLTSKDNFLTRKEAGKLAFEQKQIKQITNCLFSEDLY